MAGLRDPCQCFAMPSQAAAHDRSMRFAYFFIVNGLAPSTPCRSPGALQFTPGADIVDAFWQVRFVQEQTVKFGARDCRPRATRDDVDRQACCQRLSHSVSGPDTAIESNSLIASSASTHSAAARFSPHVGDG